MSYRSDAEYNRLFALTIVQRIEQYVARELHRMTVPQCREMCQEITELMDRYGIEKVAAGYRFIGRAA
jgi:hypothetical protein